ncbi:hypothetical protein Patl1_30401 [Pistacia atlantica]|uniref:Uncharacterized protein n=1 Tax=Pistacia atlantica TaxID=434234 RepID=A0ACC1A9V0_9ROSI|nr:hypothetical protein Patl1_30401 [Pistacia atlantica]
MESYGGSYSSQPYAPSAPSLPDSYAQPSNHSYNTNTLPGSYAQPSNHSYNTTTFPDSYAQPSNHSYNTTTSPPPPPSYYGQPPPQPPYHHQAQGYGYPQPPAPSYGHYSFPPGTNPDVIRSFEMVDRDRSGFIDDKELQQALSSAYQRFSLRTIKLLIFLFKDPHDSSLRIGLFFSSFLLFGFILGPKEFAALWSCLGEWRGIFQRYDRDRSGKIDLMELRDALYSTGYAVPPSVLQLLMSKYESGNGRKNELSFDSFVECGMIVKGLTEKFKEKDSRYTGSATLTYDSFMSMVIPFIVQYD